MTVAAIGGNKLSSFYSTALSVPFSGATSFTAFQSQNAGFQYSFTQATVRGILSLEDVTDSFSPFCRTRVEVEGDFEAILNVFFNPDNPPGNQFAPYSNVNGFQLYLTLSSLAMYPAADQLQYFWVPRVLVEQVPHRLQLQPRARPIDFDLHVRAGSPAFFLPQDQTNGRIAAFSAYCAGMSPNPWGW